MKELVQKVFSFFGFRLMRSRSYLAISQKAQLYVSSANNDLQEKDALEAQLAALHQKLAFFRTDPDYEIGFKEKAMIDSLPIFGEGDFAKMAPWLFSSSLSNHRIVHQRIDEASQLWSAVRETSGPILEIGRAAGGSTAVILGASGERRVDSVDRFPQHADITDYIFKREDVSKRLALYSQSSRDPIPFEQYGMLFIDGDHSYDGLCHDIAVFWNRLQPIDKKPAYAVFHDAARNPISYVEPVRMAVSQLVEDAGAAKVVGSWGSMLVLEKIGDIDEIKWFSKLDEVFWRSCLSAGESFIAPRMDYRGLENSMSDVKLLGASVIEGNNFDDEEWMCEGVSIETTDKFGLDNPLRIIRQSETLSEHSISTSVSVHNETYYASAHIRPLGVENVRLGIYLGDEQLLIADFTITDEPMLKSIEGSEKVQVHHASIGYRNGYFHCEVIVEFADILNDLNYKISMLDEVGGGYFTGNLAKSLAINSACLHVAEMGEHFQMADLEEPSIWDNVAKREVIKITENGSQANKVDFHGSPFIILDDLVSPDFVEEINRNWPEKSKFQPEIQGSEFFGLYQNDISALPGGQKEFWTGFRDDVGPAIVAKVAESFSPFIDTLFPQSHYIDGISTHGAMLLMEQDERYDGIGMHTHFYHNPNWVFTMLFYVGDDTGINPGTSLEYMNFGNDFDGLKNNYSHENMNSVMTEATKFLDVKQRKSSPIYESKVIEYRKNRVFAFLDGPLSFHKVEHSIKSGLCSERRIIRAHVKVDMEKFFQKNLEGIPSEDFARLMYPVSQKISQEDKKTHKRMLKDVYEDRIIAYREALLKGHGQNEPVNKFNAYFNQIKSYRP